MIEIQRPGRHRRTDRRSINRMIMGAIGVIVIMVLFWYNVKEYNQEIDPTAKVNQDLLPAVNRGVVYHKPYFSLSYVEEFELPEWVAYELTIDMMNKPKHKRDQDFNIDPSITTGSGHYHDYKSSGFRRGHLIPSADMAWKKEAMDATFLLSNVAPMREEFNDGIWLELEHNVRDWSRKYKKILVITGPISKDSIKRIGDNEIMVPKYFYKAVFTMQEMNPSVIGFLFDQEMNSFGRLEDYMVSIDSIEKITGLDLFSNLYGSWDKEIELEQKVEHSEKDWSFNEKWFDAREGEK